MTKQRTGTGLIIRTVLVLIFSFPSSIHAFDRDYCEFGTNDYSLEWAYEPNTEKIVFVLKLNSTEPEFWTGVGFNGTRSSIDFVGVLVRNGQVVMADAYLNGSGVLYTDVVGNIQTIGYDYNGKSLLVKFARPLNSPDMVNDQSLDGCTTFLLPREPANKIESDGIRPKIGEFHRFKVCDIKKHCSIDMNASVTDKKKPTKKPTKQEAVKFAKSVDVSGTGDPCSFAGKDYTVNWTYAKQTDRIQFTMELPAKQKKWWSAVGIGEWMADMDVGVLFLEDGKVKKLGDYLSSSYGSPDEDDHNDWKLESSKKNGDTSIVKFSRAVKTSDTKNDRTMEGCVFFQFAANVGKYEDGFLIQKHDEWPDLYKACDLRENCAELSFEKRAKNRKNKQKNEEEAVPETEENNDDKETDATTIAEPSTTKEAEKESSSTQSPSTEETKVANDEVKKTTIANSKEEDNQLKTTVSEISEESSGEEPETSTLIEVKSTEISLDSSGQEPESESGAESGEKNVTELVTGQPEVFTTIGEKVELTTVAQELNETVTLGPITTDQTTKSEESTNSTASNIVGNTKFDAQQCDPLKQDLAVCQSYMDNYLAQVKEWAARHEETMEAQYGKACALLLAVPHVPTLCCHSYHKICNAQVSN